METPELKGGVQSTAALLLLLVLFGCADRDKPPARNDVASSGATALEPTTDKWLGQWTGPEGTFLRLEGRNGKYEITIQDLDGPKTYPGISVGDQVRFERNGTSETIRATNGAETGMKWLAEKANCLTIRPGEGYCRD
jgi:hypothetical protein